MHYHRADQQQLPANLTAGDLQQGLHPALAKLYGVQGRVKVTQGETDYRPTFGQFFQTL
jgi:hypothetical protein